MKRVLALLIAVLCIFGAFSVSASASEFSMVDDGFTFPVEVEFSDDFGKLYYQGASYTQFNDSQIKSDMESTSAMVNLTDDQKQKIGSMQVDVFKGNDIIYAYYNFKNGGQLSFSYLRDEYIDDYNNAMQNNWDAANIDFNWPQDNIISAMQYSLKQNKTTLFIGDYTDYFDVYVPLGGKSFGVIKGMLYVEDDEYYYIDYADAGITYNGSFDINEQSNVIAYKITDEELCRAIEDSMEKNRGEELGFLTDDKFTEKVSDIFLIIVFAVIPFGVAVLSLIFALRSKTRYKNFFALIGALAAADLIVFIVLMVLFNILKV